MLLHLLLLQHLIQILHLFPCLYLALQRFRVFVSLLFLDIPPALFFSECNLGHLLAVLLVAETCELQLLVVLVHLLAVERGQVVLKQLLLLLHGLVQLLLLLHLLHQLPRLAVLLLLLKLTLLLTHLDLLVQLIPANIIQLKGKGWVTDIHASCRRLVRPAARLIARGSRLSA